jgi:hypothetical protein
MQRKSLLALFALPPFRGAPAGRAAGETRPDAVYQAAMAIRSRIDDALQASRRDSPPRE